VEEVAPGVRRILCDNPGPFTFRGTNTYLIGRGEVAVLDPGRGCRASAGDPARDGRASGSPASWSATRIATTRRRRRAAGRDGRASFGFGPHLTPPEAGGEGATTTSGPTVTLADGATVEGDDWR
jgi:hypothetical protein